MSFCASFIVAMFAGPKYAMEPVSWRSPAAVNVASSASALLSAPEPQPDSVSIAAAAIAVAVTIHDLIFALFIAITVSSL